MHWYLGAAACALGVIACSVPARATASNEPRGVTIEDVIQMRLFQRQPSAKKDVVAFSPDGSVVATVIWQGDLARNVNVYSLFAFRLADTLADSWRLPPPLFTVDFDGDPTDQMATPIHTVRVLRDNRTVVFIAKSPGRSRRALGVEILTREVTELASHASDIIDYSLDEDGRVRLFTVELLDDTDTWRRATVQRDGVSIWDTRIFPGRSMAAAGVLHWADPVHTWQVHATDGDDPASSNVVYDSRVLRLRPGEKLPDHPFDPNATNAWKLFRPTIRTATLLAQVYRTIGTVSVAPNGRTGVLWPYAPSALSGRHETYPYFSGSGSTLLGFTAAYGVVDFNKNAVTPLLDALASSYAPGYAPPVWLPEKHAIVVHTLPPRDREWTPQEREAAARGGLWMEIDLDTRSARALPVPADWRVVRWDAPTKSLMLMRGSQAATLPQGANGEWTSLNVLKDLAETLNTSILGIGPVTNGRVVVGVKETLRQAPELVSYDLRSGRSKTLTDLNPWLRERRLGEVSTITWSGRYSDNSFGYLIKPVGYEPGKRYPLALLFMDQRTRQVDENGFFLASNYQQSAFAIQTLAAAGIAVLFTPAPPSFAPTHSPAILGTAQEGPHVVDHVESAIFHLNNLGLIDPERVAIAGYSRAAYWTQYVLMHSKLRFAAASVIDGGGVEYIDGGRPWSDEEIASNCTPTLFEGHGPISFAESGRIVDQLAALGRPVEAFVYSTAPHDVALPLHRWRSLATNTDWFRFWLQGYERKEPAASTAETSEYLAQQYARWRRLRDASPHPWRAAASRQL